ncbi:MAG: nickel pincer cofactor biosynthesis protein LarC [Deltaproteobacteria bacterium]|nr:nickel pincer cofactor biosynthesis protein LarC [Deltaproteobacteria bacterium]
MTTIENNPRRVLYLDCFSGLSGDMIVSALIDVGVPFSVIENAALALPLSGFAIRHEKEMRNSLSVSRFFVDVDEGKQPHRHFSHIRDMINGAGLSDSVKQKSIAIFEVLAKAEAKVHGTTVEKVHFHEVGAVDSIIDIVGAAAGIDYLNVDIVCRTVPVGTGFVDTQHGRLPLPAPATLNILAGVPLEGTEITSELTTPTGAAIVRALATSFGPMPHMIPENTGFGAGSRNLPERPGVLRAVLGRRSGDAQGTLTVLEANIDDMTGELAAHAVDRLLTAGALDAWMEPIQMKKGRPALKISVLCQNAAREHLGRILMRETTTIGVRYYEVSRMVLSRQRISVVTHYGQVHVKVSSDENGIKTVSPEFEECRQLSLEANVPLKDVMSAAVLAYHQSPAGGGGNS